MDRDEAMKRHRKLTEEGWIRRFTAEEPRLSEMKQFYESLGLEVLIESGMPDEGQECVGCFDVEGFEDRYKTIYTRGQEREERSGDEELFG